MTYNLKPCPFCQSTSVHTFSSVKDNGASRLGVQCWECGAEISKWFPWATDDERQKSLFEAVAKWNNRVTPTYDTPDDLLKSLRATWCGRRGLDELHLVNPDGPEAADRIEALTAEVERLREALTEAAAVIEHKVPMLSNISLPGKRLVAASVLRKCMETLDRAKENPNAG